MLSKQQDGPLSDPTVIRRKATRGFSAPLAVREFRPLDQKGRWILWCTAALTVAMGCLISLSTFSAEDESWFLRVLQRVNAGDVLYRDVYYPLLPLPVYLGAATTAIFGTDFLVLEALLFICFIATAWICDSIARSLKLRYLARALLILGLAVWSSPGALAHVHSLYQPLATLFLLVSLRMVLGWAAARDQGHANRQLAFAAIAAGASFASKDQIGALALAAIFLSVAAVGIQRKIPLSRLLRMGAVITIVFAGTITATLLPVILQGGLEKFAEYFVVERLAFVETAEISYLNGLKYFFALVGEGSFVRDPFKVAHYGLFVLTPVVSVLLLLIWRRRSDSEKWRAAILFAFALAAAFAAYPRADVFHVQYASAVIVVGLIYGGDRLLTSRSLRVVSFSILALGLGVALAEGIWASAVRVVRLDYQPLGLPHFEYAMALPAKVEAIRNDAEKLQLSAETGPVFLLAEQAGFYYMVTHIENPTPFDYPLVASMGRNGEARMIRVIESNKSAWVCVQSYPEPLLRPARLEGFVRTRMEFVESLSFCDLYRSADPGLSN